MTETFETHVSSISEPGRADDVRCPTAKDVSALESSLQNAVAALLDQRNEDGHWRGQLSSSALSTATAVCALSAVRNTQDDTQQAPDELEHLCENGLNWLVEHQNSDGGWGDTVLSKSNISTTALCWAALSTGRSAHDDAIRRCEHWLTERAGSLEPDAMAEAIRKRYGKDKTFSVPILTALALTGRLGSPETAWKIVPQLPFELAACPHSWWAALQLPVVSYALPALIAIGQVRHHHRPSRNPLLRALRSAVSNRTLRLLGDIQPTSGGYLEATPLTSFVVLSLVGAGLTQNEVISKGVEFLVESAREDGSWAIDSDLATWVTTLSVRALSEVNSPTRIFSDEEIGRLREWLIGQQYQTIHPYTHAAPGGWAWTNLPGGVPDADDTPGVLLALRSLDDGSPRVRMAVANGIGWLLDLQNRDGGIPTFCRGWGALPFDQSSADLTAHCLRAWRAWEEQVSPDLRQLIEMARTKAIRFLMSQQHHDGSWTPLWFGNQHAADDVNPTYGTSRVLMALAGEVADASALLNDSLMRAAEWMLSAQNSDGGWGGASECPSSIEETALATEALAAILRSDGVEASEALHGNEMASRIEQAISGGVSFLVQATQNGREFPPTPIGFYFAKLWYYETLYPLIDTVGALGSAISLRHERHAPTRFPHQPSTSPR